jgi:hypothetical protein
LSLQERRALDAMSSAPVVESVVETVPVLDHVAAVEAVHPVQSLVQSPAPSDDSPAVDGDAHPVHVDAVPPEDESALAPRCHSCGGVADEGDLCSACEHAFHSLLDSNTLPPPRPDAHPVFGETALPSPVTEPILEKAAESDPIAIAAAALDALSSASESKPVKPADPDPVVVSEPAIAVLSAPPAVEPVEAEPVVAAVATITQPTPPPMPVTVPAPGPKPEPVLATPKIPAPAARREPAVVAVPAASGGRNRSVVMTGAAVVIVAAIGVPLTRMWLGRQEVQIVTAPVARPEPPKPQAKVATPPRPAAPTQAVAPPSPSNVVASAPVIVPPAPAPVAPKTALLTTKPAVPASKPSSVVTAPAPAPAPTMTLPRPATPSPAPVAAAPVASVATLPVAAPPPSAEIVVPPPPTPTPSPAPTAAAPVAPPTAPFYEAADVSEAPKATVRVEPQIPAELKGTGLNEVLVARVLVSQTGHPALVGLLRHSRAGAALDEAVIAAVKQWKFAPARKRGEAVSCWYHVAVTVKGQ